MDPLKKNVESRPLIFENKEPVPLIRKDIVIYQGPEEEDGSPTYTIYDPWISQYYMITWQEALILKAISPGMTMSQLLRKLKQTTTLPITLEGLKSFFQEAERRNLLSINRSSEILKLEADSKEVSLFKWLLYHYLYIRVPLINPDSFLKRTLHYFKPLLSTKVLVILTILFLAGLFLLIPRFDEFLHTYTYFFNFKGFIVYAITISIVKVFHEFGHAYMAKYYGVSVPRMGLAFIVLWPVLYTDVTDAWKLSNRKQRLAISFAGMGVELCIAGLCTLGWALSEPGIMQSIFFVICSVTWISTLIVNLNPAMRFDGYYIFCDLIGVDNLQSRAFALTRWQLRKWFLGLNIPPPEETSSGRLFGMVFYSIYTWIYRLVLYTAIAVFVYYEFTKVLGIILFVLEVIVFIIWPFYDEFMELNKIKKQLTINKRSLITGIVVAIVLIWFIVPLPHKDSFPAISIPNESQIVYAPEDAIIEEIYVKRGDKVTVGQPLIKFFSKQLAISLLSAKIEKQILNRQITSASDRESNLFAKIPSIKAELATVVALEKKLNKSLQNLTVKASLAGTLYQWDETLRKNQAVTKNSILGKIGVDTTSDIISYIPEDSISDLYVGQPVTFVKKSSFENFEGHVENINPIREKTLIHHALASTNKGVIPVKPDSSGNLHLIESYYEVHISLEDKEKKIPYGIQGEIEIYSKPKSKFMSLIRYIQSIIIRESQI